MFLRGVTAVTLSGKLNGSYVGHKAISLHPLSSLSLLQFTARIHLTIIVNVCVFHPVTVDNQRRRTLSKELQDEGQDRIVNTESSNIFTNNCPTKDTAAYANDQHVLGALD